MEILLVTPDFAPSVGGLESVVGHYKSLLPRYGVKPCVVTATPAGADSDPAVIRLPSTNRRHEVSAVLRRFPNALVHIFGFRKTSGHYGLSTEFAQECVQRRRPFIWSPTFHPERHVTIPSSFPPVRFLRRISTGPATNSGKSLFSTLAGVVLLGSQTQTAHLMLKASLLLCMSVAESRFWETFGADTVVIPNGTDHLDGKRTIAPSAPCGLDTESKRVVLALGRHVPYKRFDLLVRALPHLVRRVPNAHLVIAGQTEDARESLLQLASSVQAETSMTVLGHVNSDELSALYEVCAVHVQPSAYEAFGLTVVDAWAHSKPVVHSGCAALSEFRDGAISLKRSDEPTEWAEAIARVLEDYQYASQLGAQGRANAEAHYSWPGVIRDYLFHLRSRGFVHKLPVMIDSAPAFIKNQATGPGQGNSIISKRKWRRGLYE